MDISKNKLQSIGNISHLRQLNELAAENNEINTLSTELFQLQNLNDLALNDNYLTKLPIGFEDFPNLLYLRIADNRFDGESGELIQIKIGFSFSDSVWTKKPNQLRPSDSLVENNDKFRE